MSDNTHYILFICVARVEGSCVILTRRANHTEVELETVRQVVVQSNASIHIGRHYKIVINQYCWNFITGIFVLGTRLK